MNAVADPYTRIDSLLNSYDAFKATPLDFFKEQINDFAIHVTAKGGRVYEIPVRFIVDAECEKQLLDWNRPFYNISLL
jgi:hypothetical protein